MEHVSFDNNGTFSLIKMDDGKVNAFSFEMMSALNASLDQALMHPNPIILIGRDGKFCAGFDLSVVKGGDQGEIDRMFDAGLGLAYRLMDSSVPVIVACSGHALAMGALLLLAADYRVCAGGEYKIGLNEVSIGVEIPQIGVDLVSNRITRRAQVPTLALGRLYGPQKAMDVGFIDEVSDQLWTDCESLAHALNQIDMRAHNNNKKALRRTFLETHRQRYG